MKIAVVLGAAALLSGCSMKADMDATNAGIARFHQEVEAGQFARIYDESSPLMKAAATKDGFVGFLSAVHKKLGAFKGGNVGGFNDNVSTGGHRVIVGYQAQYQNGPAAETFTFAIEGGRALLVGYNINSTALILR